MLRLVLRKNWKFMKNVIRCFIFDLDGTLVDTYKANFLAYQEAFKNLGINFTNCQYKKIFGLRFDYWIKKILPKATKKTIEKIKKDKSFFYKKNIEYCEVNTSLVTFLKYVKNMGFSTCLTTTASFNNASYLLEYFNLTKYFDYIVYGENVTKPKPHPNCFILCFDKFKLKPKECVIFEDSETGCEAALKSGANLVKIKNDLTSIS